MPDVSIIIVHYQSWDVLHDCLASIRRETHDVAYEVIVVDNASPDVSGSVLAQRFPWLRVVESKQNIGFAGAANLGARQAQGRFLFFLNPDTVILNDAVHRLLDFMDATGGEDVGACGTLLVDENGGLAHSYDQFKRPSTETINRMKHLLKKALFIRRSFLNSHLKRVPPPSDVPFDVEYISGAALFVRRVVFEELGGFDADFFMYIEEVDLQRRMSAAGYRRVVVPGPQIRHLEGRSFSNANSKRIMLQVTRLRYFQKQFGHGAKSAYKYFYLVSLLVESVLDLYRREHALSENLDFMNKLFWERYR